jgi:outer membrane protein TolC
VDIGQVEEENLRAELASARARLNALMALPADFPLEDPTELPTPRLLARYDEALITAALENNPELAALAQESRAAQDGVRSAKEEYWPEFWGQFGITGNQSFGPIVSLMLPTTLNKLAAQVEQAKDNHRQSQATHRQARLDLWGNLVTTRIALRSAERQIGLYSNGILPRTRQIWETARDTYSAGSGSFGELVETQQALLDARLKLAEAVIEREKRLAELEELAGVDIETLAQGQSASAPASAPSPRPAATAPAGNTDARSMP